MDTEAQRKHLIEEAKRVQPLDDVELEQQNRLISWLTTEPVFVRQSKHPDFPECHVTLFNVVLTPDCKKIALFEHIKAGMLLSPGGHLDNGETLQECVVRETFEELGASLQSYREPTFFISYYDTKTSGQHWEYWLPVFLDEATDFTKGQDYWAEYTGYRWYTVDEAAALTNVHAYSSRLLAKLKARYTRA